MLTLLAKLRTRIYSLLRLRTLGALAIAVDADGKVVLIRNTYDGQWFALPGGGLKRSESFRDGALREAREEAGIHATPDSLVTLHSIHRRFRGRSADYLAVYVIEDWEQHEVRSWEIAEIRRFDPAKLPANLRDAHRRRIEEWRDGRPAAGTW